MKAWMSAPQTWMLLERGWLVVHGGIRIFVVIRFTVARVIEELLPWVLGNIEGFII